MKSLQAAQLILQTGERFYGQTSATPDNICCGELVFNTGMTGYVETLTDPSYAGQIVCFTYPLIGNYGAPSKAHWESECIQAAGVIMTSLIEHHSHHEAKQSLGTWLVQEGIPVMVGVDTRALTQRIRTLGTVMGAIAIEHTLPNFPDYAAIDWLSQVSIAAPEIYEGHGFSPATGKTIIAVDCGLKLSSLRLLSGFPWRIRRVPFDYDYTEEDYDGVFLSNGPGDPSQCTKTIAILQKALAAHKPVFGICLGTQLMARAVGAKTFKLPFGHHAQNHPCLHLPKGRCYLTAQNHGYAVEEASIPSDWRVLFRHLNDGTVAGISHRELPFFSVQFHPEAGPGPKDTQWLFDEFYQYVAETQ